MEEIPFESLLARYQYLFALCRLIIIAEQTNINNNTRYQVALTYAYYRLDVTIIEIIFQISQTYISNSEPTEIKRLKQLTQRLLTIVTLITLLHEKSHN